jgi:FkbM family methyltransferase
MGAEVLGWVVKTGQGVFCVDPDDQFVSKSLLERGEYGRGEIENLGQLLTPASKVLLVGAHIGSLLVPISKKVASLVGVEANPKTFERLELNVLINQCRNVRLIHRAASDQEGSLEFVMNRLNSGASKRMPLVRNDIYFYDNPEVTRVPSARLDDLLPDEQFDLVFMDIEGSEVFAMRGMPRILSHAKFVVSEFYPFMVRDVAGAGVEDFLEPLADFQTVVITSLRKVAHGDEILSTLRAMFDANQCDNGLIFIRERTNAGFKTG